MVTCWNYQVSASTPDEQHWRLKMVSIYDRKWVQTSWELGPEVVGGPNPRRTALGVWREARAERRKIIPLSTSRLLWVLLRGARERPQCPPLGGKGEGSLVGCALKERASGKREVLKALTASQWGQACQAHCAAPRCSKVGGRGEGVNTSWGWIWEAWRTELAFALCVYTKTSSISSPEMGLPFRAQTNGLFIELKAAISLGNIQFQQLAWSGREPPSSPPGPVAKQCFDVPGAPNGR